MEICPVEIAAELQLECDMFDDISTSKLTVMVTGSGHADLAVDIPYCIEHEWREEAGLSGVE